jgi:predicted phosphodiesterase
MSKWQPEEEHLLRLLIPTNSHPEIAEEFRRRFALNLPGFNIERTYDAVRRKCSRDNITPENTEDYNVDKYEERWEYIKQINEEYKLDAEVQRIGIVENARRKILSLSDIHFPFALHDELNRALIEHADAEVIVLNGDILDGYIFSTYGTSKRIAALKEYMSAFELVKRCSESFPSVVIVEGNHDRRPAKALARSDFRQEASQIFRPDLLAKIANGELLDEKGEPVEKLSFDNVIYQKYDSWYVRVGKTIFCHPDAYYGSWPGQTVIKLCDYFMKRLGGEHFDSVVVGHTHRIYKGVVMNKLLIEQGAMVARTPYQHRCDLRFPHAMNGYAIIYQDEEGNTDFTKSNVIYLGSELPPKKEAI